VGSEPQFGQTKEYKVDICSAKNAELSTVIICIRQIKIFVVFVAAFTFL
jgi:hypothetical protein